MQTRKQGLSPILILVLLALAAGVILYFWSQPFQTRVNEAARQASQWTPENIQKDPVGYLTWAREETGRTEQTLQASTLSLKTKLNEATRQVAANRESLDTYTTLLGEAKSLYREAAATDSWPATLRGVSLTEAQLKAKIVEAFEKVQGLDQLIATYNETSSIMSRKLAEVDAKLSEVRKLRGKLATDLEIAKVKKSVEGLGEISDRLAAIMDTASALTDVTAGDVSLEDLVTPTGDQKLDEDFSKIMAE